uniref:Zinc finger CHCC-type domain-containing protein n=1 Tax=Globisporangium ultimum (strain ATCC 200006 / CBS 805.95 / DAOM BR144) TaxID=431595 RepID=K3WW26_GLOUD
MLRRGSQAAQRAVAIAARAHPERSLAAVGARFQQRAGFATIYDVNPTPYEDINRHRSDAEQRIAQVPVVEVEGNIAVCDGGGGALGHPLEYIQLDTVKHHGVQTCNYCGVRYKQKEGSHGHH